MTITTQDPPRYNLDTSAILVELTASVWTARKLDKGTTDQLIHDKNAKAKDAARVNKHLLAGRNELERVQKIVDAARAYFYTTTLPWSDSGIRLLPASLMFSFNDRMREFNDDFDQRVAEFVSVYPSLITAQAMALGDMFKRDDYPPASIIRNKFAFNVIRMPVPSSGDFRVDVGNAAREELRQQFAKVLEERVSAANLDLWERLKKHILRMSDRLSTDNIGGEEKHRRFHDTLVDNGLELCDMMKALNVTNDAELERTRNELEMVLKGAGSADELRKNADARKHAKEKVDAIVRKFGW